MIQKFYGIPFQVHGPSRLTLVAYDDQSSIESVEISLLDHWAIRVKMKLGHTIIRGPFPSRDAAISHLRERMN